MFKANEILRISSAEDDIKRHYQSRVRTLTELNPFNTNANYLNAFSIHSGGG